MFSSISIPIKGTVGITEMDKNKFLFLQINKYCFWDLGTENLKNGKTTYLKTIFKMFLPGFSCIFLTVFFTVGQDNLRHKITFQHTLD